MYHIAESSHLQHKHCIDIHFTKECGRHCDGWWDVVLLVVLGLADMAMLESPARFTARRDTHWNIDRQLTSAYYCHRFP
jgi:hypothetical protein